MGFHVCMIGALLLLHAAFDDDFALAQSLLLNLFTQYLRDDKNNALCLVVLYNSLFIFFNTNLATFLKQCFLTLLNDQCNTICIYIHFIYIHLQFIDH